MSVKVHIFQALTVTFEGSNEAVAAAAGRAEALKLQRLYGKDVLPDDILAFFSGRLQLLKVVVPHGSDRETLCARAFGLLYKHVVFIEEKPTPTRFSSLPIVYLVCCA